MRTASIITAAVAAAAIGTLALPPISANAADSAIVTIGQLKAQGFNVQVDRIGVVPATRSLLLLPGSHAIAAIDNGKHVIMVNVEADCMVGPLLQRRAAARTSRARIA